MSYIQSPEFPVITWLQDIPAAITVNVLYNAKTEVGTVPIGQYWGFGTDLSGDASSDSLMGVIASTVQETFTNPLKHNVPGALIGAGYEWSSGTDITLNGFMSSSGFAPVSDIEVSLLSSNEIWGSDGTSPDFDITTITNKGFSDFNIASFFSPYQKTWYDERDYTDTVYGARSISGDNTSIVRWGTQTTNRLIEFPNVYAAYVYAYRRQLAEFSTPAHTEIADPNNLLENMRNAAIDTGNNFTFRIYQDDGQYRQGRLIQGDRLNSLESYVSDVSARGARFKVSIPFIDLGTSTGGAI